MYFEEVDALNTTHDLDLRISGAATRWPNVSGNKTRYCERTIGWSFARVAL